MIVTMSSLPEHLGILARTVGQLLSLPTKALTIMAGFVLVIVALLTTGYATRESTGAVATVVVIALWVALALPVVTLARRRRKWLRRTEQDATGDHQVILPAPSESTEMIDSLKIRGFRRVVAQGMGGGCPSSWCEQETRHPPG